MSNSRLKIAIVAPSMGILGGQAVQASRLIRYWRDDPDIDAWLVPINPTPPAGLRWMTKVKFLRTIVTQALANALVGIIVFTVMEAVPGMIERRRLNRRGRM